MKKRILLSLLLGFIFTCISLAHKTGGNIEPMPYMGNNGYNINNGIVMQPQYTPQEPSLAERGWPKEIVSITTDEDKPSSYYKSIIVKNLAIDYVLFVALSFGILTIASSVKKSVKKS